MTHGEASLSLAALLRDAHHHPSGVVAYVYCTGRYAVFLRTDDGDYVLLDEAAVNVYRVSHKPAKKP